MRLWFIGEILQLDVIEKCNIPPVLIVEMFQRLCKLHLEDDELNMPSISYDTGDGILKATKDVVEQKE